MPAIEGLDLLTQEPNLDQYIPSVVLMTDGVSNEGKGYGDLEAIWNRRQQEWSKRQLAVPIYAITFGSVLGMVQFTSAIVSVGIFFLFYIVLDNQLWVAGPVALAEQDSGQNDFLFPGSQVATEIFKTRHGGKVIESKTVFRSPLVIYSWDNTAQALIKEGLVRQVNNAYYIVDLPKLVKIIIERKAWSSLGLPYYGPVLVTTTDPAYSNSGAMFAGLMANVLVGEGSVADESNVEPHLPTLKAFFNRLGFMERSSLDIFEAYLTTGEGAKPLVVGYENQMIEFAIQRPNLWNQSKDKVRVLYPVPTCWSAHDLIALNGDATGL